MNDNKTTPQLIDELIESASSIEAVKTPPFFKDKVLNRLSTESEVNVVSSNLNWLAPKLQLAALLVFVVLNLAVLYYYNNSNQEQQVQSFAEAYGFSSSQEDSILN